MNRRYEFRYNTQIGEVEYRERCSFYFRFRPLDKRAQNSILLDAQSEGIAVWDRDVDRYLHSNRVSVYNPLEEFIFIFLIGTKKTALRNWQTVCLVLIRIGQCFSIAGSSTW